MSYSARDDAACPAGSGLPAAPSPAKPSPAKPSPAELGQAILNALYAAGLALNLALTMIPDGPAAAQVRRAIDELDAAVSGLPHLVRAAPGPGAQAPGTGPADPAEGGTGAP